MPNIHSQVKVPELSNYREIFPYSSLYRAHDLKEYPIYNIHCKKKKKTLWPIKKFAFFHYSMFFTFE